jgi:autotransporter-associated beta strand protein
VFEDDANAGTATLFCEGGGAVFHKQSSAAQSTMTVSDLGNITFLEHAGAGEATITAEGAPSFDADYGSILFLSDHATAGDATLIANSGMNGGQGAYILFWYQTRGHNARVEVFGNATLDISAHDPVAPMILGSLEGDGRVVLGANNLTVGRNLLNTIFSGIVKDGESGNTGGSITKVSGGTLALAQDSSYTGGTTVESGNLLVNNTDSSGTGTGPVLVTGGTLGGTGIIAGAVSVGTGERRRGILEPGINGTGLLTIQNTLNFGPRGNYRWDVDTTGNAADKVAAAGVTISNGALFSAISHGNTALPIGTVFTVIDSTSAIPISGTFSNLPDNSSFTAGNNTFQVSYEGGDGNDLTVTVVP